MSAVADEGLVQLRARVQIAVLRALRPPTPALGSRHPARRSQIATRELLKHGDVRFREEEGYLAHCAVAQITRLPLEHVRFLGQGRAPAAPQEARAPLLPLKQSARCIVDLQQDASGAGPGAGRLQPGAEKASKNVRAAKQIQAKPNPTLAPAAASTPHPSFLSSCSSLSVSSLLFLPFHSPSPRRALFVQFYLV